jgi:hypothetical protein
MQEEHARHWARLAAEGAAAPEGGPAAGWPADGGEQQLLAALPAGAEAAAAAAEVTRDLPHLAPGLEIAGLEG